MNIKRIMMTVIIIVTIMMIVIIIMINNHVKHSDNNSNLDCFENFYKPLSGAANCIQHAHSSDQGAYIQCA